MKFVHQDDTEKRHVRRVEEVIESVVSTSPDYYAGELESLKSKVRELTKIVGAMASLLSDHQQGCLVDMCAYGWKEHS